MNATIGSPRLDTSTRYQETCLWSSLMMSKYFVMKNNDVALVRFKKKCLSWQTMMSHFLLVMNTKGFRIFVCMNNNDVAFLFLCQTLMSLFCCHVFKIKTNGATFSVFMCLQFKQVVTHFFVMKHNNVAISFVLCVFSMGTFAGKFKSDREKIQILTRPPPPPPP